MNFQKMNEMIAGTAFHHSDAWQKKESPLEGQPDLGVLREGRREPPQLPLVNTFRHLAPWVEAAAEASNSSVDYVAGSLLAAAAAAIGNSRVAEAFNSWREPAVLWLCLVGDPSTSKSPAMDCILDPIRAIEAGLAVDFQDQQREHAARIEAAKAVLEAWQREARDRVQANEHPPAMPTSAVVPDPLIRPRIVVNDATPEAVAKVLAGTPRGVLLVRDELAGWLGSFGRYEGAGRGFWVEGYGARSFVVDRVKYEQPLRIPRLAVSVLGAIQPQKLEPLFSEADDGLAARFLWFWPNPRPFQRSTKSSDSQLIEEVLSRLHGLPMVDDEKGEPVPLVLPLSDSANDRLERWCVAHDGERGSGLYLSALGKMRGQLLRLALILEQLWWAADSADADAPTVIGEEAVSAAAALMTDYFKPMAERVYGDAALPEIDRNTAALARWIVKERPSIINVRTLRRDTPPTPQLRQRKAMNEAIEMLVEAGWLQHVPGRYGDRPGRARADYLVNPKLWEHFPSA